MDNYILNRQIARLELKQVACLKYIETLKADIKHRVENATEVYHFTSFLPGEIKALEEQAAKLAVLREELELLQSLKEDEADV